jgi:hypothetical protein
MALLPKRGMIALGMEHPCGSSLQRESYRIRFCTPVLLRDSGQIEVMTRCGIGLERDVSERRERLAAANEMELPF